MDKPRPLSRLILWMLFFFWHNIYGHCAITFFVRFFIFPRLENTKGAHPFPFTPPAKKVKSAKMSYFHLFFFPQENHIDYWMDAISFLLLIYKKDIYFLTEKKNIICNYNLLFVCFSPSLHSLDSFCFSFCQNQKGLLWEFVLIFIERTEHSAINTGA